MHAERLRKLAFVCLQNADIARRVDAVPAPQHLPADLLRVKLLRGHKVRDRGVQRLACIAANRSTVTGQSSQLRISHAKPSAPVCISSRLFACRMEPSPEEWARDQCRRSCLLICLGSSCAGKKCAIRLSGALPAMQPGDSLSKVCKASFRWGRGGEREEWTVYSFLFLFCQVQLRAPQVLQIFGMCQARG